MPKPFAIVFIIAAPVGVVNSDFTEDAITGTPLKSSKAAGAGTGILPCAVSTHPEPRGKADAYILSVPNCSTPTAVPTISTIESTAPTSWK